MKIWWPLLFMFCALSATAIDAIEVELLPAVVEDVTADTYILTAEMWARPRSGQAVLNMPPVRNVVTKLLKARNHHLLIRYPGGDEGSIWAEELQSWLIALGIEPALIEKRPGSTPEQIELQLMTTVSVK